MTKTKEIIITTASIELDGMKVEVKAQLGEYGDIETTMSFPAFDGKIFVPSKTWVDKDYLGDESDLQDYAWKELVSIIEKYNHWSISEEQVEVEDEDAEDED